MERRRFSRNKIKVMIDYLNGGDIEVVYTKDISMGGMFIETTNIHKPGSMAFLDFYLPGVKKMFKLKGKVAWVKSSENADPDKRTGMGIEFVDLDDGNKAYLKTGIKNIQGEL